jgi:hypothetical protein
MRIFPPILERPQCRANFTKQEETQYACDIEHKARYIDEFRGVKGEGTLAQDTTAARTQIGMPVSSTTTSIPHQCFYGLLKLLAFPKT